MTNRKNQAYRLQEPINAGYAEYCFLIPEPEGMVSHTPGQMITAVAGNTANALHPRPR